MPQYLIVYTRQWDVNHKRIGWIASRQGVEATGRTKRIAREKLLEREGLDVRVINHGSVWVLYFESERARIWRGEHIGDDAMGWGPNGIAVEPRYVAPIIEGLRAEGYNVR